MSNTEKGTSVQFGLSLTQKILYLLAPIALSVIIIFAGPLFTGVAGTIAFILMGIVLGLVTFFISAGWGYSLEIGSQEIKINDRRVDVRVPMDKIGMLLRNGGFPFPTLWLVLRGGGSAGKEIPSKGVDPKTRELIEAYQRRNPGKSLTYVPVAGGYIRSIPGLAAELKRRIPPLTVDERLGTK
jgi:hypothetical protein